MTEKANKENDQLVKKSNAICRSRWDSANIYERRIVALLASRIRPEDDDFKEYEIPITELFANCYGGANYKTIRETLENLLSRTITIMGEDKKFTVYTLFTKSSYVTENNTIRIKINSELKPHFLSLKKRYTQYQLMEFFVLSSVYAQALFEFLKSWEDCKSSSVKIEELHLILGVPEIYKTNFAYFKRGILEPALKQINEKTSLKYNYGIKKEKKKISEIIFVNLKEKAKKSEEKENMSMDEILSKLREQINDKDLVDVLCKRIEKDKIEEFKNYGSWFNEKKRKNNMDYNNYRKEKKLSD